VLVKLMLLMARVQHWLAVMLDLPVIHQTVLLCDD
jgi:hypothetical protein